MDEDRNGVLSKPEFVRGLKQKSIKSQLLAVGISLEDAKQLFDMATGKNFNMRLTPRKPPPTASLSLAESRVIHS